MKIGILTYHRTNNYGALMQAIALRRVLQDKGHEAFFIDYWPKYHRDMYMAFNMTKFRHLSLKEKIKNLFIVIRDYKGRKKRIEIFQPFLNEFIIPYCKPYHSTETYDIVVYGSDQIWRRQIGLNNKIDTVYLGDNHICCKEKISYAASMGNVDLDRDDLEMLRKNLSTFSFLGVREKNIYDVLNSINLSNVRMTLDPTLLLQAEEWDKLLTPKRIISEPYAVTYQNKRAFDNKEIERECKRRGLRLITIRNGYVGNSKKDVFPIVSPYDFISLIKYADFCFMASFHGLAFSINYGRQFYTSFVVGADRGLTILRELGLENHFIAPFGKIPDEYDQIDYSIVHECLENKRGLSIDFLNSL